MARKKKQVIIQGDPETNRDAGKIFWIEEMSSSAWHFWLFRLSQAVGRTGIDLPSNIGELDAVFMSKIAFRALGLAPYEDVRSMVGELVSCIKIARNRQQPDFMSPLMGEYGDHDIEEVKTLGLLESEVIELHTGFSIAGVLSRSTSTPAKPSPELSKPQTSQEPTPSSSAAVSQVSPS